MYEIPSVEFRNDYSVFELFGTEVAGLGIGAEASGLPKLCVYPLSKHGYEEGTAAYELQKNIQKRHCKLAQATPGSGHDCWLKSVTVWTYCVAAQSWIQQLSRYTSSMEFVSSQSTMVLVRDCPEHALSDAIHKFCVGASTSEKIRAYRSIMEHRAARTQESFQKAIAHLPECTLGFCFKINYMTLKTIYNQRKTHERIEWQLFIKWMLALPDFKKIVLGE